jgi:hypothetical protein
MRVIRYGAWWGLTMTAQQYVAADGREDATPAER